MPGSSKPRYWTANWLPNRDFLADVLTELHRLEWPLGRRILLEAPNGELAELDAFDATLTELAVGYGGVVCDVLLKQRVEAIRDAVQRGLARLVSLPDLDGYWPHRATPM